MGSQAIDLSGFKLEERPRAGQAAPVSGQPAVAIQSGVVDLSGFQVEQPSQGFIPLGAPAPRPVLDVSGTAPAPAAGQHESRSLLMEPIFGFANELASALQIARNVAGVTERAARKLSAVTGESVPNALLDVQQFIERGQRYLTDDIGDVDEDYRTVRKLLRGIGAAPVQAVEYGVPALITRRPTVTFALIDAAKEMDKGFEAAVKAGAIGAATGYGLDRAAKLGRAATRIGGGAAVAGAGAALHGGELEDIVAGSIMGGAMAGYAGRPQSQMKIPLKSSEKTKVYEIIERPEDLDVINRFFASAHNWANKVEGGRQVVMENIDALQRSSDHAKKWTERAQKTFSKLTPDERKVLIEKYLDNPDYTLTKPPSSTPQIREAFIETRTLLEDVRQKIIQAKRAAGEDVPDNWGIPEGFFPHRHGDGPWVITVRDSRVGKKGNVEGYDRPIETGWMVENRRAAQQRAEEYAKLRPEAAGNIKIHRYEHIVAPEHAAGKGKRFFRHAERRSENLPGWIADEESLFKYLTGSARFIELNPMRPKMLAIAAKLDDSHQPFIKRQWKTYMDRIEGRPDHLSQVVNEAWINYLDGRPDIAQKGLGFVRSVEVLTKLGFSPVTALANMSQFWLNCVDAETEALTKDGWKHYNELQIGDDILCYDIHSDTCHWSPLEQMNAFPYEGPMFTMESRQISSRTTPGHRWAVEDKFTRQRLIVANTSGPVRGQGKGTKYGRLDRRHGIPLCREVTNLPVDSIYSDDFVSLCGWIATEGHYKRDGRSWRPNTYRKFRSITLSQSPKTNPDGCMRIRKMLDRESIVYRESIDKRTEVICWSLSARDSLRFAAVMEEKVPTSRFVSSLCKRQLRLLFDAMMEGDGYIANEKSLMYSTTAPALASLFQMICTLLGITSSCTKPKPNGKVSKKYIQDLVAKHGRFSRMATVQRAVRDSEHYKGIVWCPTVASGFWMARRNGRIYVTGNSLPVLGPKYAWKGFREGVSAIGRRMIGKKSKYDWLIDDLGLMSEAGKADALGTFEAINLYWPKSKTNVLAHGYQKLNTAAMWMFQKAELGNRLSSAIGAFERARASGKSVQEARRMAREVDVRTQFIYDISDAPALLNNPWSRTMFQFQNFFLKQLEFMFGMARGKDKFGRFDAPHKEMARFMFMTLGATGALGIPGIETLDSIVEFATEKASSSGQGYSFLRDLREHFPNASRGVPGMLPIAPSTQTDPRTGRSTEYLGIDLTKNIGFGDYFTIQQFHSPVTGIKTGPVLQEVALAAKAIAAPEGREKNQAWYDLLRRMSPAGRRLLETMISQGTKDGSVIDNKGRIIIKDMGWFEKAITAAGVTPVKLAEERQRYIDAYEKIRKARSQRAGYVDAIVDAYADGDYNTAARLEAEAVKNGHTTIWKSVTSRQKYLSRPRLETLEEANRGLLESTGR